MHHPTDRIAHTTAFVTPVMFVCLCAHVHVQQDKQQCTKNNIHSQWLPENTGHQYFIIIMIIIIIIYRFNTYTHALHIYTQIVTIKIIWNFF